MIDVIVSQLIAAGINAEASNHADPSKADPVPTIRGLIDPVTSNQTYPLHLPKDAADNNAVYSLASRSMIDSDGWNVGRVDTYVVSLRSPSFDTLRTMSDGFETQIASAVSPYGFEITDAAADYEFDQRQCRAHFELQVTSLATENPTLPMAFVHHLTAQATANELATLNIRQTVTEQIVVILIADQDQIDTLRKVTVSQALLGLELPDGLSPLEYVGGGSLAITGKNVFWRDVWSYQRVIRG